MQRSKGLQQAKYAGERLIGEVECLEEVVFDALQRSEHYRHMSHHPPLPLPPTHPHVDLLELESLREDVRRLSGVEVRLKAHVRVVEAERDAVIATAEKVVKLSGEISSVDNEVEDVENEVEDVENSKRKGSRSESEKREEGISDRLEELLLRERVEHAKLRQELDDITSFVTVSSYAQKEVIGSPGTAFEKVERCVAGYLDHISDLEAQLSGADRSKVSQTPEERLREWQLNSNKHSK